MPGVPAYAGGTPGDPVVGPEWQNRPARVRGVGRRGGRAAPHWGRAESRSGARCYDGRRAGSGKGCGCNYFTEIQLLDVAAPGLSGPEPGTQKIEGKRNRPRLAVWGGLCWVAAGYRGIGWLARSLDSAGSVPEWDPRLLTGTVLAAP